MAKNKPIKVYPTIGSCGLDCGLCPVYYTVGHSGCPGCCGLEFFNKHPSCSIITCCVKNNNFETCSECKEFPCYRLRDWDKGDSFISHRTSISNLNYIRENGLEEFIKQQDHRIRFLKTMLDSFNEGRSKSFYCIASALLPLKDIEKSLNDTKEMINKKGVNKGDLKTKSRILKEHLNQYAEKNSIQLKLRRK